jgi:DNA-binding NtrC family response regulator
VSDVASQEPLADLGDPEALASVDSLFERLLARSATPAPGLREWVNLAEAWRITHALRACRGNRSAAARTLGIGRRTLYSKMEKLGIAPTFPSPWDPREPGRREGA